jgi:hypothetical protein
VAFVVDSAARSARAVWAADLEQLKAERFDLGQHAVQGGLIGQDPAEHGLRPGRPSTHADVTQTSSAALSSGEPEQGSAAHTVTMFAHYVFVADDGKVCVESARRLTPGRLEPWLGAGRRDTAAWPAGCELAVLE